MENESLKEFKEEQKEKLKERVKSKILEQENADFLIRLLEKAESKTEVLKISALGMTYKRTGFHFDVRLEKMGQTIKYLEKNEKLSFYQGGLKHKLIIGDNYPALLNLLISYKKKVKVIYIDPPYGKDDLGEFAKTNYDNAITRDNLLSMLYPRLSLAKQLLRDDGVIFCSIDDRNQAYVKGLFDEVFGEGNFVATSPRKTGAGNAAARSDSELRKPYDFVLIYSKFRKYFVFNKILKGVKAYKYNDKFGTYDLKPLQASGSDATKKSRPNLYYPIYYNTKTSIFSLENDVNNEDMIEILPSKIDGEDGRWMWNKDRFLQLKDKEICYIDDKIYKKVYFNEDEDQNIYQIEKAYFDDSLYRNANGTNELSSILSKNSFSNPKPMELIKHIIKLSSTDDEIILDFFAGSGTTAHAVMQLNREDGGKRQCILVTNNEKTELNPNGIAFDVTSKRLKRIMSGECYDGTKNFQWLEKNAPYGDSLEVSEIVSLASSDYSVFEKIDEKLYEKDFKGNTAEKIEWICKEFELTCKKIEGEE